MKKLTFKSKKAMELLGVPFDPAEFKKLIVSTLKGKETGADGKQSYHMQFTPNDIRTIRKKLEGREKKKTNELPAVICFHVSKGGTGKTTISGNIGVGIALQGYRVLLIDGDPQASLTTLMGIDSESDVKLTLRDLLNGSAKIQDVIKPIYENTELDLIPADNSLVRYERESTHLTSRELVFHKFLQKNVEFLSQYDIILIDTGPTTNILNFNLMLGSDIVVAVIMLDGLSMKAIGALMADLNEIRDVTNKSKKDPDLLFIANGFHPSKKYTQKNLQILDRSYHDQLLEHIVPEYAGFGRQGKPGKESSPLIETEPNSLAAATMLQISRSFVSKFITHKKSKLETAQVG